MKPFVGRCIRCEEESFDLALPCECGIPAQVCRYHATRLIRVRWGGTWWKPWTWLVMRYVQVRCPHCFVRGGS